MEKNIWTAEAVSNAILHGNANLEIVFTNYLREFLNRLVDHDINLQEVQSVELLRQKVLDGIEELAAMQDEFLSVTRLFAVSQHSMLERYLPDFFERLLVFYEEHGVTLYTGTGADLLRNDHFRFFNQSLLISLTAQLLENQCFDILASILHARFKVYDKSYKTTREVNFIRFREYNYTLNEFMNTDSPKRISVTADYIYKYARMLGFEKLVKADILLYYISLWNPSEEILDPYWYPELSVYNRDKDIMPYLVSKAYFNKAKVLFRVNSVEEYKKLLDETNDRLQRGGLFRVPLLKVGLMYDNVGTIL